MRRLHIHTYEEWFLDYAEGRLDAEERLRLEEFVEAHPELQEEFMSMQEWQELTPPEISLPGRKNLLRSILPVGLIHADNYTDYLIAALEGDLDATEKSMLDHFMQQNPSVQKEAEWIQQTRLVPDMTIVFPDKKRLRHTPVLPLYFRVAGGMAAAILIALGAWWYTSSGSATMPEEIRIASFQQSVLPGKSHALALQSKTEKENNDALQQPERHMPVYAPHVALIHKQREAVTPVTLETGSQTAYIPVGTIESSATHLPKGTSLMYASFIAPDEEEGGTVQQRRNSLVRNVWKQQRRQGNSVSGSDILDLGTAAVSDMTGDKWVIKIDRDDEGKTQEIKFSSPLLSFRLN